MREVPLSVMVVLKMKRLQAPITQLLKVDDNGNAITREGAFSVGVSMVCKLFCQRILRFFERSGSAPSMFMKNEFSRLMLLLDGGIRGIALCPCRRLHHHSLQL